MYILKFTDYSFRILIYLGNHPKELFTIEELSNFRCILSMPAVLVLVKLVLFINYSF